jgi:hypothetical protein
MNHKINLLTVVAAMTLLSTGDGRHVGLALLYKNDKFKDLLYK